MNSQSNTCLLGALALFTSVAQSPAATLEAVGSQVIGSNITGSLWRDPTTLKPFDGDADNVLGTLGYYLAKTVRPPNENYTGGWIPADMTIDASNSSWLSIAASGANVNNQVNYGYDTYQDPTNPLNRFSVGYMGRRFSGTMVVGTFQSLFNFTVNASVPSDFAITISTGTSAEYPAATGLRLEQISGSGTQSVELIEAPANVFGQDRFYTFRVTSAANGDVFRLSARTANADSVAIKGIMIDAWTIIPTVPATITGLGSQVIGNSGDATGIGWKDPAIPKTHDSDGDNTLGTSGYYLAKTVVPPNESYSGGFDTSFMTFSPASWLTPSASGAAVNGQANYTYRAFQDPTNPTTKLSVGFMGRLYSGNMTIGNYFPLYNFAVGAGVPTTFAITIATHDEFVNFSTSGLRLTQTVGGTASATLIPAANGTFDAAFTTFRISNAKQGDVFQLSGQAVNASSLMINAIMIDGPPAAALPPYAQWKVDNGLAPDAADIDYDGDGLSLFLEYALNGTPNTLDLDKLPTVQRVGGLLQLNFNRVRPATEVTYIVEAGENLVIWNPIATNPGTVGQAVSVSDTVNPIPAKRFIRLRTVRP